MHDLQTKLKNLKDLYYRIERLFFGAPDLFLHPGRKKRPDQPAQALQAQNKSGSHYCNRRGCSASEKSEPFSYWKKVRIFRFLW